MSGMIETKYIYIHLYRSAMMTIIKMLKLLLTASAYGCIVQVVQEMKNMQVRPHSLHILCSICTYSRCTVLSTQGAMLLFLHIICVGRVSVCTQV